MNVCKLKRKYNLFLKTVIFIIKQFVFQKKIFIFAT